MMKWESYLESTDENVNYELQINAFLQISGLQMM